MRKLAKDLLIDLSAIQHAAGAVITRADVLAAARGAEADSDVRPVCGVQARMAEKMTLSHNEIPAAKVGVDVDCTVLLRLRERLHSAYQDITPFVLTLRLLIIALSHNTILNSTWVDSPEGPRCASIGVCTWVSGWPPNAGCWSR